MTVFIVPVIFVIVFSLSVIKKQNAYASFVEGAGQAVTLMISVLPYLLTIMMAVEVFRASGVSAIVADFVTPAFNLVGIPGELAELVLLRPLSGAGSLAILDNIFVTYGTDTLIGRCASTIYGSSETVFYIASIYFSQSKVKNLRYAIPVALLATIIGCIVGCALCRIM